MKKVLTPFVLLVLLVGSFLSGAWYSGKAHEGPENRRILYYVDPMNPAHTSDTPGTAPCGMALEPVYADENPAEQASKSTRESSSPGAVTISHQKQQLTGVEVGTVGITSETHTLRTLGKVAVDENRLYRLIAATDGWMADADQSTTGSLVREGQLMALVDIYNNDFFAWQQRYLTELGYMGFAQQPGAPTPERYQHPMQRTAMPAAAMPQAAMTPPSPPQPGAVSPATPQPAMHPPQTEQPAEDIQSTIESTASGGNTQGMPCHEMPEAEGSQPPAEQSGAGQPAAVGSGIVQPAVGEPGLQRHSAQPLLTKMTVAEYYAKKAMLELMNLGVGEQQLRELVESRQYATYVEMRSPVTGIVLSRNVSPGQRIDRGTELFTIADLSRIWIVADVFGAEAPYIKPGMQAKVTLPQQTKTFTATVTDILAPFNPTTRTLKVRLETDNSELVLRPEMFADVEFLITMPPAVTVPADAILDSGAQQTVFVSVGSGTFEPRSVEAGWRFGDRVEIVSGLAAGEQIVTSGNFLIDSESRMKLAAAGLHGNPEKDPMCGAEVYPSDAKRRGLTGSFEGNTYYFCSAACRAAFDKAHAPSGQGAGPPQSSKAELKLPSDLAKDPVCGMLLPKKKVQATEFTSQMAGKQYYFCSKECKERFDAAPQRFLMDSSEVRVQQDAPSQGERPHD